MSTEGARSKRLKRSCSKRPSSRGSGSGSSAIPPPSQPPPPGPSDLVLKLRSGLQEKSLIPEVGMQIQYGKPEWSRYTEIIDDLGWREFVKPPREPFPDLVREFYANLTEKTDEDYVTVFGHRIDIGPTAINRQLGLEAVGNEDVWRNYDSIHHDMDYGRIEHLLSLGNGLEMLRWRVRTIHARSLCKEARNWFKFLHRRFFGIGNASDVTVLLQRLIFLMVIGQKIDVGRHIHLTICARGEKLKKGVVPKLFSMPYPSLITDMCLAAGVPEPTRQLKGPVHTNITVSRDNNPTLREFFAEHWAGEGSAGWERPRIRRSLGVEEIENRQRQAMETGVNYIPDIEDEPIAESAGPSTSIPRDEEMHHASPEHGGPSGTASFSQPPPTAEYDFWSQPGWQNYQRQQESQWVQTQRYWADLQGQMDEQRQQIHALHQAVVDMDQRNTRNLQRQDEYWLQREMHRINLDGSDAPAPPNYDWPPHYGPPQ